MRVELITVKNNGEVYVDKAYAIIERVVDKPYGKKHKTGDKIEVENICDIICLMLNYEYGLWCGCYADKFKFSISDNVELEINGEELKSIYAPIIGKELDRVQEWIEKYVKEIKKKIENAEKETVTIKI